MIDKDFARAAAGTAREMHEELHGGPTQGRPLSEEEEAVLLGAKLYDEKFASPGAKLGAAPQVRDSSDIHATLAERGARYGEFRDHASVTQNLKQAMRAAPQWEALDAYQAEALDMIQHKIGRILCGDVNYDDSWRDIVGYATLALDRLPKEEKKNA